MPDTLTPGPACCGTLLGQGSSGVWDRRPVSWIRSGISGVSESQEHGPDSPRDLDSSPGQYHFLPVALVKECNPSEHQRPLCHTEIIVVPDRRVATWVSKSTAQNSSWSSLTLDTQGCWLPAPFCACRPVSCHNRPLNFQSVHPELHVSQNPRC